MTTTSTRALGKLAVGAGVVAALMAAPAGASFAAESTAPAASGASLDISNVTLGAEGDVLSTISFSCEEGRKFSILVTVKQADAVEQDITTGDDRITATCGRGGAAFFSDVTAIPQRRMATFKKGPAKVIASLWLESNPYRPTATVSKFVEL